MKIEECIKKRREHYEESLQRAVEAEVSVLENWKETEVYKLQTMESQAEGFLKNLKLMSRYCGITGVSLACCWVSKEEG